jgi:hypothetical protein
VGRHDRRVVGQQCREPVGGGVLRAHQRVGVLGAEQVGATGGAEEQRAAGEDGHLLAGGGITQRVGQVGVGVAGRREGRDDHPAAHGHLLAVGDGRAVEGDVVRAVDQVGRAGLLGEGQPTGHVVVVDVGLEDVGQAHAVLVQQLEHPVDVSLRVDHECDVAVVGEVAAVTEGGGLDRDDGEGLHVRPPGWCR